MSSPEPRAFANNPEHTPQEEQEKQSQLLLLYHGLMGRVAAIRMSRATNVMERMDHKDALYKDLGQMAMTQKSRLSVDDIESRTVNYVSGTHDNLTSEQLSLMNHGVLPVGSREFQATSTATGEPAIPRTLAEQLMARRIDRSGHKRAIQNIYIQRHNTIHGTTPGPRSDLKVRERIAEKAFGSSRSGPLEAIDIRGRSKDRYLVLLESPALPYGSVRKPLRAREIRKDNKVDLSSLTATEKRLAKNQIHTQTTKAIPEGRRIINKARTKADKQLRHVTNQEFLGRWRDWRRERAIGRIQEAHKAIEYHEQRRAGLHPAESNAENHIGLDILQSAPETIVVEQVIPELNPSSPITPETTPTAVDKETYKTALHYLAGDYRKRGENESFTRMSVESFRKGLAVQGIDEGTARKLYIQLQSEGYISQTYIKGEGYRVLKSRDELESRLRELAESDD